MSNKILRNTNITDDRRASNRLPIESDVRYRVLGENRSITQVGMGKTLNISGSGVLFTTESTLPEGERVELSISWPAQLNNTVPLKLVAMGRVVRTDKTQAAIAIE